MGDSIHPLSSEEWEKVERALPTYTKPDLAFNEVDPGRVVLWIARTGMHPCVLAEPEVHNLQVVETPRGLTVSWDRPKKRGTQALTEVPLKDPLVAPWAREFVESVRAHPVSLSTLQRACYSVGKHCGVRLSPRALRHTFLRWVADRTRDPTAVMTLGNVSGRVAMGYTARARVEEYRDAL